MICWRCRRTTKTISISNTFSSTSPRFSPCSTSDLPERRGGRHNPCFDTGAPVAKLHVFLEVPRSAKSSYASNWRDTRKMPTPSPACWHRRSGRLVEENSSKSIPLSAPPSRTPLTWPTDLRCFRDSGACFFSHRPRRPGHAVQCGLEYPRTPKLACVFFFFFFSFSVVDFQPMLLPSLPSLGPIIFRPPDVLCLPLRYGHVTCVPFFFPSPTGAARQCTCLQPLLYYTYTWPRNPRSRRRRRERGSAGRQEAGKTWRTESLLNAQQQVGYTERGGGGSHGACIHWP